MNRGNIAAHIFKCMPLLVTNVTLPVLCLMFAFMYECVSVGVYIVDIGRLKAAFVYASSAGCPRCEEEQECPSVCGHMPCGTILLLRLVQPCLPLCQPKICTFLERWHW